MMHAVRVSSVTALRHRTSSRAHVARPACRPAGMSPERISLCRLLEALLPGAAGIAECPENRDAGGLFRETPLRMPLQAQYETGRVGGGDGLYRAVLRIRLHHQSLSWAVDRLAVQRVHHDRVGADDPRQGAGDGDGVFWSVSAFHRPLAVA